VTVPANETRGEGELGFQLLSNKVLLFSLSYYILGWEHLSSSINLSLKRNEPKDEANDIQSSRTLGESFQDPTPKFKIFQSLLSRRESDCIEREHVLLKTLNHF
jgi:hypothetical protein